MESKEQKDIAVLAFFIWERNGRVDGHAMDHWLEAEYLIRTCSFVSNENRIEWSREMDERPKESRGLSSVRKVSRAAK
jgi:hypothetical protein